MLEIWWKDIFREAFKSKIMFLDSYEMHAKTLSVFYPESVISIIMIGIIGSICAIIFNWYIGLAIYNFVSKEPWFSGKIKDNYQKWRFRYAKWFGWTIIFTSFPIGAYLAPMAGFFGVRLYIMLILGAFSCAIYYYTGFDILNLL